MNARITSLIAVLSLTCAVAFGQLSNLTSANATSADPAPHAVNEVSMIVTPTYNLQTGSMVDTVYAAYMRYPAQQDGPYSNNVSVGTVGGTWTLKPPPPPQRPSGADFPAGTFTGDPVLATNPSDGELHPHRVYLASTTIYGTENQISLWTLDAANPGANWVYRQSFDYFSAGPINDKPAINVSQATSTFGHAYAVYLRSGKVHFWRNTAGETWTDKGIIYPGPFDPQSNTLGGTRVDVDNEFGSVFVSFLDLTANKVYVLQSDDEGNTWTKYSAPTYCADDPQCNTCQLLTNNDGNVIKGDTSSVYSPTQLHTFWAYRMLELVYHQRKLDGTGSEVVMRTFYHPTHIWYPVHKVSSQDSTHDSWQGAVTCHNSGVCAVAFYDHASGDSSSAYRIYNRVLNVDGTPLRGPLNDVLLYPNASDATRFFIRRMEYHDFFLLNNFWYTADVFTSGNGSADVLVTRQTW